MRLRWNELVRALDHRGDGQFGIDPRSGDVRFFDVHDLESDDPLELLDMDRYVLIAPPPNGRIAEWIERFAEETGRNDLIDLALGRDPLHRLKETLSGDAEALQLWKAFYRQRLQEEAEVWVETAGLAPENPPPWR